MTATPLRTARPARDPKLDAFALDLRNAHAAATGGRPVSGWVHGLERSRQVWVNVARAALAGTGERMAA